MAYKISLTILLYLSFLNIYCQEKEYSSEQKVKIVRNDSNIYFVLSNENIKEKQINKLARYYWYKKNRIHSNIGNYEGHLLNGEFSVFDSENNLIIKGLFINGIKSGEWTYWDSNGSYLKRENWKNGILKGKVIQYKSGKINLVSNYSKGEKNGLEKEYNSLGTLVFKRHYKNGKLNGKSINLKTKAITRYSDGQVIIKEEKQTIEKTESGSSFFNKIFKNKKDD